MCRPRRAPLPEMPTSKGQGAKRAFVATLKALGAKYGVAVTVSRASSDADVRRAHMRVLLKAHPDKGGSAADAQRLQTAREAWESAAKKPMGGRPKSTPGRRPQPSAAAHGALVVHGEADTGSPNTDLYRIRSLGVLLTYFGVRDQEHWRRFLLHVERRRASWGVRHWCATLEATKQARLHIHLMLQFLFAGNYNTARFVFEGLKPNASPNDLLGDGYSRRKLQESLDRAMFYCWADKLGTQRDEQGAPCRAGNYEPCWTDASRTYSVKGRWPENLWKAHKLSHEVQEEYLYLCRDGVVAKKRNLDAVKEKEAADAAREEMEARVKRIRANPHLFQPFPEVPAAAAWLERFKVDALRYPLLVALGPSGTRKTEWAKALFKKPLEVKVGSLQHFPERMRSFMRGVHDGLVLDDVRDFQFLVDHQEKLQGKYDALVEFGSTPGGHLSYQKDLFAVPVVVTANLTTANRSFLSDNDYLGNPENRVVVHFPLADGAGMLQH